MGRFVACIRGINVGGNSILPMQDARTILETLGFKDVSSVGNTGNMLFDSTKKESAIKNDIEKALEKKMGKKVSVALRSMEALQAMVKKDPFTTKEAKGKVKTDDTKYVVFLCEKSEKKLPVSSAKGDVVILNFDGLNVFCLSRKINGKAGYPNLFVEAQLKTQSTTRNWNVVQTLAKKE